MDAFTPHRHIYPPRQAAVPSRSARSSSMDSANALVADPAAGVSTPVGSQATAGPKQPQKRSPSPPSPLGYSLSVIPSWGARVACSCDGEGVGVLGMGSTLAVAPGAVKTEELTGRPGGREGKGVRFVCVWCASWTIPLTIAVSSALQSESLERWLITVCGCRFYRQRAHSNPLADHDFGGWVSALPSVQSHPPPPPRPQRGSLRQQARAQLELAGRGGI